MNSITLSTPPNFSFKSTLYSHGWADLPPFNFNEGELGLNYVFPIPTGKVYRLQIKSSHSNKLDILINNDARESERRHFLAAVNRMFRLDEDYDQFYSMAKKYIEFSWIVDFGAGRLLRCSSLWEDMVKMLCTTNCTWRLTQIMVENLVEKLGDKIKDEKGKIIASAFPDAKSIAFCNEEFLRGEIKMGYRAPYLLEFSQAVTNGDLDLDEFENTNIPTPDLYKHLRAIKGFGDYAVSNLLKLLGRYDYLGADSWSRQKFAEKHNKGNACDDEHIKEYYNKFGKWSGLFFWMDVCEDWYKKEKPW